MKKSLIALAALTVVGAASAQSSVTLFGIVDATYQNLSADRAGSPSKFKLSRLTNSGYNSSRLGFRGVEDLGGGMSASFWLEAGLNNDDGTLAASSATNRVVQPFNSTSGANPAVRAGTQGLTFNRRSTVSLSGGWGEVRLGRDYVPAFWNHTIFDPFGTNGVGSVSNVSLALGTALGVATTVRASNSIGYFLPGNLGGFYGQAMYAFAEGVEPVIGSAGNGFQEKSDGQHLGLRLGYAAGPLNIAYGYGTTKASSTLTLAFATIAGGGAAPNPTTAAGIAALTTAAVSGGRYRNQNLGGQYDFGVAKLMAQWNEERISGTTAAAGFSGGYKHRTWMLGTSVPVGAGEIRASYTRGKSDGDDIKGNLIALGYVHNLSKRTAVYATYSRLNNSGDTPLLNYSLASGTITPNSLGGDSRGIDIGVRHSF